MDFFIPCMVSKLHAGMAEVYSVENLMENVFDSKTLSPCTLHKRVRMCVAQHFNSIAYKGVCPFVSFCVEICLLKNLQVFLK